MGFLDLFIIFTKLENIHINIIKEWIFGKTFLPEELLTHGI